ncbi:MAG TPA: YeeE/YedE family protein [Burkholderiaceae bacterium]|nr:YeeE/YedE family protein [Burkholderiaceae bacterium]
MTIDWINFTPGPALAGGVLVGMAAGLIVLANGRVAGISGITGGLLVSPRGDMAWRAMFLAGLLLAPVAWSLFSDLPEIQIHAGYELTALAGLIVGIGTRYGSGCTSGHGVCGLARLSPRSLVATLAFMGTGFLTVFVVRHVL